MPALAVPESRVELDWPTAALEVFEDEEVNGTPVTDAERKLLEPYVGQIAAKGGDYPLLYRSWREALREVRRGPSKLEDKRPNVAQDDDSPSGVGGVKLGTLAETAERRSARTGEPIRNVKGGRMVGRVFYPDEEPKGPKKRGR